jgi:hypothetical protein
MPGCCGLEIDRWIKSGQTVELEIDGIGTVGTGSRRSRAGYSVPA